MTRKPYVHQLVPTVSIDRYLRRINVRTPESEVAATIEAQIAQQTDPRWTPAIRRQTVRYALWRHHRNLVDYAIVMRGRRIAA